MKSLRLLALVLLVGVTPTKANDLQKQADDHHEELQSSNEGIIFARIIDGQKEFGSAGLMGKERPTIDEHTLFEIGSITKAFTGILLADQVLKGTLKLETPITDILPSKVAGDASPLQQVTLVSLATHTSGLPRLPSNLEDGSDFSDPYAHYSAEKLYEYLSAFTIEDFEGSGTMSYSNLGMGLLGHLLELVSDQTYEELLAEVILEPLSMSETYFQRTTDSIPEIVRDRFATGHLTGKPVSHWRIDALGGAGAIVSSANDLLKFAEAHWSSKTPTALKEAMRLAAESHSESMGLGWFRHRGNISHGGQTGGFASNLEIDLERKSASLQLANSTAPSVEESIQGDFTSIEGFWSGTLETPLGDLPQVLWIRPEGHCRIYSLEQTAFGLEATQSKFLEDELICRFPSINGSFTANLVDGKLEGEWVQSATFPLTLTPSEKIPSKLEQVLSRSVKGDFTNLQGYWSGYLGGPEGLFVIIHFLSVGSATDVSLFSPDQTNAPLPVSSVNFDGEKLQFQSKPLNARFSATLTEKQLNGTWNQGVPLPLQLEWSEERPTRE